MPTSNDIIAILEREKVIEATLQPAQGIRTEIDTVYLYNPDAGGAATIHDETLKGKGTNADPLGISDEVMEEIENAGKIDDVRVDGVSVVTDKIAEIDLTGKVDKTSEADKVYGTDAQGNQTTYDVDGFGKVDDVLVNGTSVVTNKIAEVEVPTAVSELTNDADYQNGTQVSNTVTSAINTHNTSNNAHSNLLTPITQDIDAIEEKIPAEASSSNQLADKAYVDGKVGDLNEWTTEQYTPTTTNFVVGHTYTVEEAFQRTASLFAGQQGEIDDIEAVIPAQATAQNQLADKSFVNATIATNSANFRGNWATWTNVPTQADQYPEDYVGNKTPTNNDYMVVSDASDYVPEPFPAVRVETKSTGWGSAIITVTNIVNAQTVDIVHTSASGEIQLFDNDVYVTYSSPYWSIYSKNAPIIINDVVYPVGTKYRWSYTSVVDFVVNTSITNISGAWRFIYIGTWATDGKNGWHPAYRIGTAFTQEQQAAIDSGITKNMVDNYVNPTSTANTAYNKRITALETDKRDIINSANKVYATDANGANKNDLVYDKTATAETIAQRGTDGVLKVGTPVDNADATTKQYVDAISGDLNNHIADKNNPHEVTKAQVGLGNVDNTSDLNKPISTATQTALNAKQDTLTAGQNITITNNVISATGGGAVYNAGEGILINSNNDIMTNNIIWRDW